MNAETRRHREKRMDNRGSRVEVILREHSIYLLSSIFSPNLGVLASWRSFLLFAFALTASATTTSLDTNWRFSKGDIPAASQPSFDDSSWQSVSVPHDFSILGPFDKSNPSGGAGAFLPAGIAWYRHHLSLPSDWKQKKIFVQFDGIQSNATIYLDDHELGHRPNPYVEQFCDLSPYLGDHENVLAVRVDTSKQPASRWYTGSGINRHVHLIIEDPFHFQHDSTVVTASNIAANSATVHVRTKVVNESAAGHGALVEMNILDANGKSVASEKVGLDQMILPGNSADVGANFVLPQPQLWDLDRPYLYTLDIRLLDHDRVIDQEAIPFGIRLAQFEPNTGFWLNGKNFKIKGVCVHEDVSALGNAAPLSVWEDRLKTLKSLGVNAIRPSHNPFSPQFLSLCDRLGLLVMDEMFDCWTVGKEPYDYHLYFKDWSIRDLTDTVRRDRNHPSIILYSAGNEIHDTPHPDIAIPILESLVKAFHENDPTRPVTQALFRPNVSHDYDDGLADLLDVIGTNYRDSELLAAHEQKPSRKIIGTENGHDRKNWLLCRDNPPEAGQFLWSGVDYLGESSGWPRVVASPGLLDRTGEIKPEGYQRESWWSDKPMVFVCRRIAPPPRTSDDPAFEPLKRVQTQFADWTPKDLLPHEENVEVYSNTESVELLLNGQSLGSKPINHDASPRVWKVKFAPGTLVARASNAGKVVATNELKTAGKATKIVLTADHSSLPMDFDHVSYVRARIVDENGTLVPTASDLITFSAAGPGRIIATDSADNSSHESFQSPIRKAYQGKCVAIIRATANTGDVTVMATAPGLQSSTTSITAVAK